MRIPLPRLLRPREEWIRPRGRDVNRLEAFSDAVFGFAVTLLVISLEVPKDYDSLMRLFSGLPAFGLTFLVLCGIWRDHYLFFRRFGLEDRATMVLNMVLLFVVVAYLYPLKFMFNAAFSFVPGAIQVQVTEAQGAHLFVVYDLGFAAVQLSLMGLYLHARRRGETLGLEPVEQLQVAFFARRYAILAAVGLASCAVAILVPVSARAPLWAGLTYVLVAPLSTANRRHVARTRARRFPELTKAPAPSSVAIGSSG